MQISTSADDIALTRMHESSKSLNLIAQRLVVFSSQNDPPEKVARYPGIIYEETLSFKSVVGEVLVGMKAGANQQKARRMNHAQHFDCR